MREMSELETLRHSCSHVMATAILRLFPNAELDIGPPTENGFYYDVNYEKKLDAEDLHLIEVEMKKIIKENQKFCRMDVSRERAIEIINNSGQARFKMGRLNDIPSNENISFYQNGEFIDLCAGPHINYTKKIKAFKLLSIAGAYHRGDEKNIQLQRIYGTAFHTKEELTYYLEKLEEAKLRDHRKLGKELDLFYIDDEVGQGMILWSGKGSIIRNELQNFISDELTKSGYEQVYTPHIGKLNLFRTSGHFPYYKESQFPPIMELETIDNLLENNTNSNPISKKLDSNELDGFLLRPMNCPMHIKLYDSKPHSYRDLPVRLAEFGTVYRWEQSGELSGMTRVRGFTQDDAHIFCTEEQLAQEIEGCLDLVKLVFNTLGMKDYRVRIGLRDSNSNKYVGDPNCWDLAEDALRNAAKRIDVNYTEEDGEAAFYGPKIDFVVKDVIDREWQLGTVQVDYVLPERFNLSYIGQDNQKHRPVMIHRAPFGSMERFTGLLIEHFSGNFPTWIAPEQVRILPMNDELVEEAKIMENELRKVKVRCSVDHVADKLGAKIRKAEIAKVPHMIILGKKEFEAKKISVRSRANKSLENCNTIDSFIKEVSKIIDLKILPD